MSSRAMLIGIALVIVVVAVVTIGRGQSSSAERSGLGYAPLATPTPLSIAAGDQSLPGGASSNSIVLLIQGIKERRLMLWSLAGNMPPIEIDRAVTEWLLRPDPSGKYVLYGTESALMVLDVLAQRAQIVAELPPSSKITTAQWSPDSQEIAYVIGLNNEVKAFYTRADGSSPSHEILTLNSGLPLDVAWLADGSPVAVSVNIGPVGGLQAFVVRYDRLTGTVEEMPPDTPSVQPFSPWRSPDTHYQIYPSARWSDSNYSGMCRTGGLTLAQSEWAFANENLDASSKPLILIPNVYLDRVTWLDNQRILFRGTADLNCSPNGSGLYLSDLFGSPQQIVQTNSSYMVAEDESLVRGMPYTLSPDGKLVAWAENDLTNLTSRISLIDLDTRASSVLYQTIPGTSLTAYEYQDRDLILQFAWLK